MSFYYHIVAPVVDVDLQYGVNDLSIGIHKFNVNNFFGQNIQYLAIFTILIADNTFFCFTL